MCSAQRPRNGADSKPVPYRVPLRSLDSDHTFARFISVYGPKDLAGQLEELRVEYPAYEIGTPRLEKAS